MRWTNYLALIALLMTAALFAWAGGMARPYAAFGGEDVGAICIAVYAIHDFLEAREEAKR